MELVRMSTGGDPMGALTEQLAELSELFLYHFHGNYPM